MPLLSGGHAGPPLRAQGLKECRVNRRAVLLALGFIFHADDKLLFSWEDQGRAFTAQIAPGLKIRTEVSSQFLHVGQQFSILYSLVTQRYPTEIDIEPQQYSGFWTEIVPLAEQTRTITRLLDGRPTHEFLLRQIIASPLEEGALGLPPLSVKIMMARSAAAGAPRWDVVAKSNPVSLTVLPLPASEAGAATSLLVGTLEGRLEESKRSQGREVILDLQGTANLAFFQPLDWFRGTGVAFLAPRLVQAESFVETWDTGDRRRLTMQQHHRWSIWTIPQEGAARRVEDLQIPVFDPGRGTWTNVRIPGIDVRAPSSTTRPPAPAPLPSSERGSAGFLGRYRRALCAGAVLALVSLGVWLLRKRKTERVAHHWMGSSLEKLQQQSSRAPRSFVETAHKILERYAEENHLIPGSGDKNSSFDQCWFEVEKFRFSGGEPPAEVRQRILQLLHSVPGKQLGTNETTDGLAGTFQ